MVVEEPVDYAARAFREIEMLGEGADAVDQVVVTLHQRQGQVGLLGARDEGVPVPLKLAVERAPLGLRILRDFARGSFRRADRHGLLRASSV